MRRNLSTISALLFTIVLTSCGIRTKLNQSELEWYNAYQENEQLIFQSDKGELDTSTIVKKEIYYPQYNPVEQHGKYLPQWAVVWYKNRKLVHHPDGYRLISMEKIKPKHGTSLSIDYLYSDFLFLDIDPDKLSKFENKNLYEFENEQSKYEPWQIKKLFCDKKRGIIKYITFDGTEWTRINGKK